MGLFDRFYISLRHGYAFHTVGKAANSTVRYRMYERELAGTRYKLPSVHDRMSSPLLSPFQLSDPQDGRGGHPRQFLNGGYSGATSLILLNTMINKVGCRDDAAVPLVLPSNDTLAPGLKGGCWNHASPRYSPILPATQEAVQPCPVTENLHQLKRILKSFAATARSFWLDLCFATTPFMQTDCEDEPRHQARYARTPGRDGRLIASRKRSEQVVRDVADRAGVPLAGLQRLLNDATLFYDDLHVNDMASAVLADIIHARIGDRLRPSVEGRG